MNVNKTSTTYPYIQGRLAYNSSPSSQFGKGSYFLMFVQYDFILSQIILQIQGVIALSEHQLLSTCQ